MKGLTNPSMLRRCAGLTVRKKKQSSKRKVRKRVRGDKSRDRKGQCQHLNNNRGPSPIFGETESSFTFTSGVPTLT